MIEINYWIIPIAALIPMITGFIWYNPKVMGTIWMQAAEMTDEKIKSGNMILTMGVSYVLACMLAFIIMGLSVHQLAFQSILINEVGFGEEGSEISIFIQDFMSKYGQNFRTFKHGAFHGAIGGLFFAFPILATNALFEAKSWKYIWVNVGYWTITIMLMGGVVCQFA